MLGICGACAREEIGALFYSDVSSVALFHIAFGCCTAGVFWGLDVRQSRCGNHEKDMRVCTYVGAGSAPWPFLLGMLLADMLAAVIYDDLGGM